MPTTTNPPEQTGGERSRLSTTNYNSFDIRPSVRHYMDAKFDVVVLRPQSKKPKFDRWETRDTVLSDFEPSDNVGIRLGKDGLADVDLDCTEAVSIARKLLPETGFVFGRAGRRGSHYFYRADHHCKSVELKDPANNEMVIELRSLTKGGQIGRQTVVPGSIHEGTGELIELEPGATSLPQNVDADKLLDAVYCVGAGALLARYWPDKGRHATMLALAGVFARAEWPQEQALSFCDAVYRAVRTHDPGAVSRVQKEVASTYEALTTGHAFTGIPALKSAIDKKVVEVVLKWLKIDPATPARETGVGRQLVRADAEPEPWGAPIPLPGALPGVEPFNLDLLPGPFRAMVVDISESMQVPYDLPAAAAMVALAGVVNRRATIRPKRLNNWSVKPNLWGAIVSPPGFMKSPTLKEVNAPVSAIDDEWRKEQADGERAYLLAKEEADLKASAWKELYKSAAKAGKSLPSRPDESPPTPSARRLIVGDATAEKLHEIMAANPAGVLVVRDELTGWLAQLDKPGREGERAFVLTCWNGDDSFTYDRITRGTVHATHVCMSLIGGIQPGRLRSYLAPTLADGAGNDGLMQRFQMIVWPDFSKAFQYVDRPPNRAARDAVEARLRALVTLDPEEPLELRFDDAAQALFVAWLTDLERRLREPGEHPAFVGHLSKYRSLMPTLATLLHLGEGETGEFVGLDSARRAAAWCEYLESHARRIYSVAVRPEVAGAQALLDKIRTGKVGEGGVLSIREVYSKGWQELGSPEAAKAAAEVLVDHQFLRPMYGEPGSLGGRPSLRYYINPAVQP